MPGAGGDATPAPFTIFVCSTFDDLQEEREGMLSAIRRLQARHASMEFFGASPEQPIETCLKQVRASDVLVVIVGHKYGSLVPGLGISFSQAEYEEGQKLEKPCLVYIRDDKVPVLLLHVERDPEKMKLLETWKAALQSRHTVFSFQDSQSLAVQAAADLGRLLVQTSKKLSEILTETSKAKGVSEERLREVLKRLGETEVAEAEIPDRLAKKADELIRLRADIEEIFDRILVNISRTKGVPEAPLREVLKGLGETEVSKAEIPDRLDKAANALISLRADLERLRNDRPEFAAIRERASALIDKGDFDGARAALSEGRQRAKSMREELSRTEAGFLAQEARIDRLQLNYDAACAKFAEAARLDPDNVWLWIEFGDLWIVRGSLAEAAKAFSAARAAAVRIGDDRSLAASNDRLGDVQQAQGDLAGALMSYRAFLAIAERLTRADPRNTEWQRDLSVSYDRVGEVQQAQGDLDGALMSYRASLAIRERLAKADPGNTQWQRDLSVSHLKIGDVRQAQGDLAAALMSYRDSLAIRESLTKADPGNTQWRRDLSVSYDHIGDVQQAQGDLAAALMSYRDSLAIAERLAKADPGNAEWQRDLSVSYNKIGGVQWAQGDLAAALMSCRDSLAIRERLAKADPSNAGWQADLAGSYGNLALAHAAGKEGAKARQAAQAGRAIMARLVALSPDNADWKRDLARLDRLLGELKP